MIEFVILFFFLFSKKKKEEIHIKIILIKFYFN